MYSKKIQFLLLAIGLVTSSCGTDKSNSTRNAEPTKATEPNSEEANSNKQDPANPNTQVNQNTNSPSNTNTTSATTNLRSCSGKILPFVANTPYTTNKADSLDTASSENMLKSVCTVNDFGTFKIIANRKDVYYTCEDAESLWCEYKNSDSLSDNPGNPFTHLGAFLFSPSAGNPGYPFRDRLSIKVRTSASSNKIFLNYVNSLGGSGFNGETLILDNNWHDVGCTASAKGCLSIGKVQVRMENGLPKARVLKSDNSVIDIPLVAIP